MVRKIPQKHLEKLKLLFDLNQVVKTVFTHTNVHVYVLKELEAKTANLVQTIETYSSKYFLQEHGMENSKQVSRTTETIYQLKWSSENGIHTHTHAHVCIYNKNRKSKTADSVQTIQTNIFQYFLQEHDT